MAAITRLNTLLTQKLGTALSENPTTFISENIKERVNEATGKLATQDFVKSETNLLRSEIYARKTV